MLPSKACYYQLLNFNKNYENYYYMYTIHDKTKYPPYLPRAKFEKINP